MPKPFTHWRPITLRSLVTGPDPSLVIGRIDAAIDAVAGSGSDTNKVNSAKTLLLEAIQDTKKVEGRDIALLQSVIAKEDEGRMALASVEWISGKRQKAESQLELTREMLDQLEEEPFNTTKSISRSKKPRLCDSTLATSPWCSKQVVLD